MPDPTTTAATVVATAGITGTVITGAGLVLGIPLTVIVGAVLGATIAVSRGGRVELTVAGLWSMLLSFFLALFMGVFGGQVLGVALERAAEKLIGIEISGLGLAALCAVVIALLGQSVILPALSKRLGAEIETRGGAQ